MKDLSHEEMLEFLKIKEEISKNNNLKEAICKMLKEGGKNDKFFG